MSDLTDYKRMTEEKKQKVEAKIQELPIQLEEDVMRIGNTIAGLKKSLINVVMFKDHTEVWLQYYMGLYFKKPTVLVIRKEDKKRFRKRFNDKLVQLIIEVTEFNEATTERVAKDIDIFIKRIKAI